MCYHTSLHGFWSDDFAYLTCAFSLMGSYRTSLNRVMGEYKKLNQMGRVAEEGGEGDLKFLKGKSIKKNLIN